MNNTINNNINFQGAFIIKAISADAKNELLELMPHKRIFFDNYRKEGDILFVTRKSLDKATADFIKEKHLKFRYYPKLSTKSGFDEGKPAEAAKILKANKNGVLSTLKEMYESIMPKPIREKVKIDRRDELENVFDAMGLDPLYVAIKKTGGYTILSDKKGKTIAKVSPKGEFGMNFVFVEPRNADESARRYAIDSDGKIIVEYTSFKGLAQFRKNFAAAVNFNKKNL